MFIILIALSHLGYSQPPGGDGGFEDPDEGVPIDGGAGILIAAGAVYGAKKLRDHRKKNSSGKDETEI